MILSDWMIYSVHWSISSSFIPALVAPRSWRERKAHNTTNKREALWFCVLSATLKDMDPS